MKRMLVSAKDIGVVLRNMRRQKGVFQAGLGKRVGLDQKRLFLIVALS